MTDSSAPESVGTLASRNWGLLLACTAAGALAVPLSVVGTPTSATIAGLMSLLGLYAWRWSRLPSSAMVAAGGAGRPAWIAMAMGLGLAVGLVLLTLLRLAIEPTVPAIGARIAAAGMQPLWFRAVIIYVAAVGEELIFRLLLLSIVAGLTSRLFGIAGWPPNWSVSCWAIGVAALAFAAVHLPAWSGAVPLTFGLMLGVLSLNALGGIVFGYVFVTRGIVLAMFVHAGADCAIQLIGPLTR